MNFAGIAGGVWGVAVIALLFPLLRLSYQIERRSNPEKFERWPLRYANPIGTALNINVARDAETQALRKKLLTLMAVIAGLTVLFVIFLMVSISR